MSTRRPSMFMWLWRDYLRPHKFVLLGAIVLMMIEGSMLAFLSRMIQPMFDSVFLEADRRMLWIVGFSILAIFCVRAVSSAGQKILMTKVSQLTAAGMRSHLLRHLMTLDSGYHQVNPPGQLIERIQGDVGVVNSIWTTLLVGIARDLIAVVALFSVALAVDWKWTLIALVGIPFLVLPSLMAQAYVRRRSGDARELAGRMSTRLDEVFHGINPIKLNALETYQSERYDALTYGRVRAEVKAASGQAAVPALIDVMTGVGFLGVLIFGGGEIIAGEKTVGQFMSFFTAMSLAFEPLRRLGMLSGKWQQAGASMERLQSVLAEEPTVLSPATGTAAPVQAPDIRLQDVTLEYGDLPVLKGANFTAKAGKTTALVGASGAGKSTVFNVLTRLVDPSGGEVLIDGIRVAAMSLPDLRALFSVVAQDAALFDESLRDNILLGRTDVRDEDLQAVLDAAHVTDFLGQLPAGLDSAAGPRGSNLSGGQRQRVAIARALLRNTPILLLDEATSALDTKSEAVVQTALERLAKGRTTLVIAHRLSTIRNADSIVVMDHGRVVDQGTHEELLARGGIYADLHRLQFSQEDTDA
ncbi:ATP-binding cassette, subfamily B, MsbA [Cognatiyoonia koreensis]|uniref:ATP-binding cassette, subfamily B, MsbA n=1 Tax=Cognatiyoonia koreensis TaxID=364200 RepID=A0A1I0QFV6_9RHOB|nr:ABC transporter ATP-binding protein [Cognatiyoonia koreensis]SEW25903.1 ATP-binding cassette, subfamily B, MsbA [Cognatiyoonia koreensis]